MAQGRSRSLSTFSSVCREYLDEIIKADQCSQIVDNVAVAANIFQQLIKNLGSFIQCLRKSGLKLTMAKYIFGVQEVDFLERTILTKREAQQKHNITKFPEKVKFPRTQKTLQRYIGLLKCSRNFISRLTERPRSFFQLPKKTDAKAKIPITPDIVKEFRETNGALDRCCQLALHQLLHGKQLGLMTDASFQAAGYAVLTEDDPNGKYNSLHKTYFTLAHSSKSYPPSQIKMSILAEKFLANYLASKELGHLFWVANRPVIIMTD